MSDTRANAGKSATLKTLGLQAHDRRDVEITGLSVDSRTVQPGHLFAALPGVHAHGAAFAEMAIEKGAGAILTDRTGLGLLKGFSGDVAPPVVVAEDPRQALAYAAALWFGSQPDYVVAVTGTNGKTSVATFTRQIWAELGLVAANLGTTGVEGAVSLPLAHTTPEPITLHRVLAEIAGEGVTHAAMEASSHGLVQARLDGVRLAAAGFTNFSQDHLDYHESFDAYFAAKMRLFDEVLPDDGVAVINVEDWKGPEVAEIASARGLDILTVGRQGGCNLRIAAQRFD
ncbi:MAG: Mur ligase family protein, partial [Pseudomonadota bacterium]